GPAERGQAVDLVEREWSRHESRGSTSEGAGEDLEAPEVEAEGERLPAGERVGVDGGGKVERVAGRLGAAKGGSAAPVGPVRSPIACARSRRTTWSCSSSSAVRRRVPA